MRRCLIINLGVIILLLKECSYCCKTEYSNAKTDYNIFNMNNQCSIMGSVDNWRKQNFRQSVVTKIEEEIRRAGMSTTKNSSQMENYVFMRAKSRDEYMIMVAKLILHLREVAQACKLKQPSLNQQVPIQPVSSGRQEEVSDPMTEIHNLSKMTLDHRGN